MSQSGDSGPRITRTTFELRPGDGGPPVRGDVRLLKGTKPKSAVVMCHGFKGFRTFGAWPALAGALAARGHAAINFDFSHNGVGEDGVDFSALELFRLNTHSRNVREIRRVVDAVAAGRLTPRAPKRIGLFGHSRGGGEAVLAASRDPRVRSLVTWAAISDIPGRWTAENIAAWRRGEDVAVANSRTKQQMPMAPEYWRDVEQNRASLDILAAAAEVSVPWLIVHGDVDDTVPVAEAHALFEAAGESAELLVMEGVDHVFGARHPYPGASDTLRAAADATVDWFTETLK